MPSEREDVAAPVTIVCGFVRSIVQLRRKRSDHLDEVRTVEKARIELVELSELGSAYRRLGKRGLPTF